MTREEQEARSHIGANDEPAARSQLGEDQMARSQNGEENEARSQSNEAWDALIGLRPLDSTQQCTPCNLALSGSMGSALSPPAEHATDEQIGAEAEDQLDDSAKVDKAHCTDVDDGGGWQQVPYRGKGKAVDAANDDGFEDAEDDAALALILHQREETIRKGHDD